LVKVLRMDKHESELLAGKPLETVQEAARFGQLIAAQGLAEVVILARGADGSVFASPDSCFQCVSPKCDVVSKVGAGDSFVGGLTLGLAQGLSLEDAGKLATATAASAVMTAGNRLCEKTTTERLLAETTLTRL